MAVKIITDSAADLPKEAAERHSIAVIPLVVYLGDQEFQDNVTLKPSELFQGMREGHTYKTSQPLYGDVESAFKSGVENGGEAVYIAFSSELSGTHQTSVLIRDQLKDEMPGFDLDIIDSKCASLGAGLVALKAAEFAAQGASKDEVAAKARWYAQHMEHIFTVDNLEYLVRGGRVSPVAAFIGVLLNIKPILHVEAGKLVPLEKVRGRKKVFARIVDIMAERGADLADQTIGISHGDDLEAAEELKALISERFGTKSFFISMIGAAVGAHAGPGTIAVFFLNAKED
ncbi:DegV family protein [Paenibacillus thermotolerans]|uniref:DegV family protein n=1 Tax=Paenibacillus thermotolerans TaxID=3027807 RepID=UPI002368BDBE|nr:MULTISPECIES: DegV family protein [unclassified Paenibacillus]